MIDLRILKTDVVWKGWCEVRRIVFETLRRDGTRQTQTYEVFQRDDAVAVLPYDATRGTIVLVRQFRLPPWLSGHREPLIEACAGLLDGDTPEVCAIKETEQETGLRITAPRRVFSAFMSPGAVTERVTCFVAPYTPVDRVGAGGGLTHEGEDIEVLEMPLTQAMALVEEGRIVDGKTIMLLQYAAMHRLCG